MDLGSGPGFPGIPLAIALPESRFVLTEGRKQRVAFLESAINLCKLENASVYERKVIPGDTMDCDCVITRAFEKMIDTAFRVNHILQLNGLLIFMKGPNCDEEIERMEQEAGAAYRLALDVAYTLPGSDDRRRLVVYQKTGMLESETEETLPAAVRNRTVSITSADNASFKLWKSLGSGKMVKKHSKSIVSGTRIIRELLECADGRCLPETLLVSEKQAAQLSEFFDAEELESIRQITVLSSTLFRELDTFGTDAPLLVVRFEPLRQWDGGESDEGPVLFLPLSNPDNLGAALRSAAAFGWKRVVLLREAAHPYHPRAIRSASGTQVQLELWNGPSIGELHPPFPIYALARGGEPLFTIEPPERFGLLVGQEGKGIPEQIDATSVEIPIDDDVESLNASVALGIALYELKRKDHLRIT